MGLSKRNSKGKLYSDISLHQEIRKIPNKNLNLYLKELEKEKTKHNVSRRKKF